MSSIRENLKRLDCPYFDQDDENWPENVLFTPSDARVNILVWLLSRNLIKCYAISMAIKTKKILFDPKFKEVLDGSTVRIGNRLDTKIQRLLMLSSMIGVCGTDNIELIQGTCSRKHQVLFWRNLIDLILVNENVLNRGTDSVSNQSVLPPHHCHGYTTSCRYIDKLSRQDTFSSMFSSYLQLFPPDIERFIFPNGERSQKSRISLPDLQKLEDIAYKLSQDMEECENDLKEILMKEPKHGDIDQSIIDSKCKQLELSLTTLSQTIDTYLHHHQSEIAQWCNRPQPQLSGIGPVVDTLQKKLKDHYSFFNDANTIRSQSQVISDRSFSSNNEPLKPGASKSLSRMKSYIEILSDSIKLKEQTRRHK